MVNIINAEVIIQLESSEDILYIVGPEENFCVELPSSMFDQWGLQNLFGQQYPLHINK